MMVYVEDTILELPKFTSTPARGLLFRMDPNDIKSRKNGIVHAARRDCDSAENAFIVLHLKKTSKITDVISSNSSQIKAIFRF